MWPQTELLINLFLVFLKLPPTSVKMWHRKDIGSSVRINNNDYYNKLALCRRISMEKNVQNFNKTIFS